MSAQLDMSRVVRSWLQEDGHDSADHVLEIVLTRLDATPQRRPLWPPRRSILMSNPARIALAAAAVLVVAFVGWRLLPSQTVGPGASAPPTVAPSVTPTEPPPLPASGAVAPGTYLVRSNTRTPFTVTVPSGWTVDLGMLHKGDFYDSAAGAVILRPWLVSHVYTDSCKWQGALQPVGPSKAELVAALSAQTGRDVAGPDQVTLGGLEATRFVLSVPSTFDASGCGEGYLRPFPGPNGDEGTGPPMFTGSITEIYVVETGGKATAIQVAHYERSVATDVAELQAIADSIVFVP